MSRGRNLVAGLLAGLLLGSVSGLLLAAECRVTTPGVVAFHVPTLTVQRDTPIGTVIWQGDTPVVDPLAGQACEGLNEVHANLVGNDSGLRTGRNPVYSSHVPGIGYAFSLDESFNEGWPVSGTLPDIGHVTHMAMRLVVTGPVTSGMLASGSYGQVVLEGTTLQQLILPQPVAITRLACEVTGVRTINVFLGDMLRTRFRHIGDTHGEQGFNLGLTCDEGAQVSVQFDGPQDPDTSDNSILALIKPGDQMSATGVGVQILYNSNAVKLGEKLLLERAPAGLRSYPFTARYYQTKAQVTAGDVNAAAIFTLIYQ